MGSIIKGLTGILCILASLAVLATVGIVGYTLLGPSANEEETVIEATAPENIDVENENNEDVEEIVEEISNQSPTPSIIPDSENADIYVEKHEPSQIEGHIHNYKEAVEKKATCYQAGKMKYTCDACGDVYYVDVPSTGHVAEAEWKTTKKATESEDGERVKRCIYCDEIVAKEVIQKTGSNKPAHDHDYFASVEREPSCVLAGLRKYTCSCGSFYTEQISAKGHVATDWTVAEEASEKKSGTEQRTCTVCGVLLDTRTIKRVTPSPSESPSASPTSSGSASPSASSSVSPSSTPSATPSATPHEHEYTSYVLLEPNCTEEGIRSYICNGCASSYAETIPVDPTRHHYRMSVVRPTETENGYTIYRCTRCNDTYMDNYTKPLGQ